MTVSATLDHRRARIPQVSVQPSLSHECCDQRDQQTGVHETYDGDDVGERILLNWQNGGRFVWDCGLVEGEEDGAEEGWGLVRLEFGMDVDDKSRADSRE